MANDNQIDFTVRIRREGAGELAGDLAKIEDGAKGVGTAGGAAGAALDKLDDAAKQAGAGFTDLSQAEAKAEAGARDLGTQSQQASGGVAGVGQAAAVAGQELAALRQAVDAKTASIKAGLQVERSEIEVQSQLLTAARAEQQARLQAAQAKGDEAATTRAGNALRQIEGDQLALVARAKRAEATAVQQATDARREELAALGPLNAAQAKELQASENHAKALRVEAATADQASQRARELTAAHQGNAAATDQLSGRVTGLSQLLGQMAGALGAAFTFRELVTAAAQMEQLRSGLTAVTQDAAKAAAELEFVRVVANRIGADVTEVGKAFLGLAASTRGTAVEGEPTRQVFEAVATAMGKAGKSSAETANALQALSQMASKGVVQSEELRGQLGEALPGALNAAAKGMGITTAELMKLVEEGQIAASDLFPALTKGLNELYGTSASAQTLSQEITNIKNAVTEMAANIGDSGGLSALKTGAEATQTAIVMLDVSLVAAGKSIGALAAAATSMDFSGLKQAFADIEAEAQDKMLKAAQHNDVLRAAINAQGSEALKTALAQQQAAAATDASGASAAAAAPSYVKLASDYSKVKAAVDEYIAVSAKEVDAIKARGAAAVAEARLKNDEAALRKAIGDAAAAEAAALADLAQKRQTEVDIMRAEVAAKRAALAESGPLTDQRKKELDDLDALIAKKQIDADRSREQAAAASANARAKGEEAQAAAAALSTAQAATIARVADAQANVSLLETQKALASQGEQLARLMGDEETARRFRIEQLQIDIRLTQAKAEVQRAEAEGSIAVANATLAELKAKGENNAVKEAELRASIKLAEAKLKEADAIGQSSRVTKQAIENLRQFGDEAGSAGSRGGQAGEKVAAGWKSAAGAIGNASQALADYQRRMIDKYGRPGEGEQGLFEDGRRSTRGEDLGKGVQEVGTGGYQFRNAQGMTSDAKGNTQQQWVWTRATIIDYLKQAGLDELLAARLAKQFAQPDGTVNYEASAAQKQWGGKNSTLAEALGKMVDHYKYGDGKAEAEAMLTYERDKNKKPPLAPAPSPTPAPAPSPGTGGGSGSGNTYINNITINGVGEWGTVRGTTTHTTAQSAQTEIDLLRKLAQAKDASA